MANKYHELLMHTKRQIIAKYGFSPNIELVDIDVLCLLETNLDDLFIKRLIRMEKIADLIYHPEKGKITWRIISKKKQFVYILFCCMPYTLMDTNDFFLLRLIKILS